MELEQNDAGVAVYDFTLYRGDTFSLSVEIELDNRAMDLSDWTASAWVKPSGANGFAPVCVVQGNVLQMTFRHDDTKDATWKSAKYDVQIQHHQTVKTVLCGTIALIKDITP